VSAGTWSSEVRCGELAGAVVNNAGFKSVAMKTSEARPSVWPGLAVVTVLAVIATVVPGLLAALPVPLDGLPVSPILIAIIGGLALAGHARQRPAWAPGLEMAAQPLLRLAVMLIGLRLSLAQVGLLGAQALPLVLGALVTGLGLAWALSRWLAVEARLAALLAVGSAICGASAIAATAPALRPKPEETAYALACVALFGLAATLFYPWLLGAMQLDGRVAGLVLGAAIQDTAQVTAAALLHEQAFGDPATLASATVTKLLRNLSMLVIIPAVVWLTLRGEAPAGARTPFPWFILGFVGFAALRSAGDHWLGAMPAWQALLSAASAASGFLFAMAMAAIGMGIQLAALRTLGLKPALVALLTAAGMGMTALMLVRLA
jgi:uncharacterized integral membrane protein (TIGR00698 family)